MLGAEPATVEELFAAYFANWSIELPPSAARNESPGRIASDGSVIRYTSARLMARGISSSTPVTE
jgi:hypothetical protein